MRKKVLIAASLVAWCMSGSGARALDPAPLCNGQTYEETWCGSDPSCVTPNNPAGEAMMAQSFWCGNGAAATDPAPTAPGMWGCQMAPANCSATQPTSTSSHCAAVGAAEVCDGVDNNFDGCIDEGCPKKIGACTCTGQCASHTCSPAQSATCDPYNGQDEICGDGIDNNCNGMTDEFCGSPIAPLAGGAPAGGSGGGGPPSPFCQDKVGQDPIIVASRAAVTEPFVDFAVEHLSRLSLTRTYTSADASVRGGPRGVLGRGWHHEWEGTLSCEGTTCTVSFGASGGMQFGPPAQAASLDGAETWDIYPALHVTGVPQQHRNVLARHPNGVWTLFLTDGRQLEFAVVCDACTSAEATGTLCSDPRTGGRARLTKVVDPAGNAVAVAYDRPAGVLLTVSDGLGHTLELRGADACGAGLAETLRFDGSIVATYTFASDDLARVVDADGHVLRSYVYVTGFGGLLQAVQDEAGGPLAEFSYDALGRAVGIADARTSASVEYRTDGSVAVTEYYRGPAGDTSTTHVRQLDRYGRVTSVTEGCACGEARTFDWMGPNLSCSRDSSGHIEYRQLDALGRVSRRIEYSGTACPTAPPSSLPPDSRTQRRLGAPSRRGSRSSSTEWT